MGNSDRRINKINAHSWHMEDDDWKETLRSDEIKEQIKNFNPEINKGDLLGRGCGLENKNPTKTKRACSFIREFRVSNVKKTRGKILLTTCFS